MSLVIRDRINRVIVDFLLPVGQNGILTIGIRSPQCGHNLIIACCSCLGPQFVNQFLFDLVQSLNAVVQIRNKVIGILIRPDVECNRIGIAVFQNAKASQIPVNQTSVLIDRCRRHGISFAINFYRVNCGGNVF